MLQRLREAYRGPGSCAIDNSDHSSTTYSECILISLTRSCFRYAGDYRTGQDVASGTLHVHPLQSGARHAQLLREGGSPLLRDGLSQPVLAPLRLLQRADSRCKGRSSFGDYLEERSIGRSNGFYRYDRRFSETNIEESNKEDWTEEDPFAHTFLA